MSNLNAFRVRIPRWRAVLAVAAVFAAMLTVDVYVQAQPPVPPTPPGPKLPPGKEDFLEGDAEKKALEGTWRVVACEEGGKPLRQFGISQFTFKAGQVTVGEGSTSEQYGYTLDLAQRPKQLVLAARTSTGGKKLLRVAYSLEGDRLVICFDSRPDMPAPNALETKEGDGRLLATLKRVPPRAEQAPDVPGARPETAELVRRIEWPGIHVYHTAFSSDSRLYLGGGDSGTLRVWDVATGQQLHELPAPVGFFTPDGKHVLGHNEKTIYLFDLSSGKEVRRWEPSEAVVSLGIAPDGRRFVSGHADCVLRMWDLASGKELRGFEYPAEPGADPRPLTGWQEGYSAYPAVFSPDGKQIVSASPDKRMRVWDAETGRCLRVLETFKDVDRLGDHHLIRDASFLPGGRQIAGYVWGTEKTLVVWDAATGQEVRRFDLDHQKDLAISPDGRWFMTGHEDCTVRLRDLTTGEEVHRFELADVYAPRGLAFSPDGRYALCGSHRGWVYLWRLPRREENAPGTGAERERLPGATAQPAPPSLLEPRAGAVLPNGTLDRSRTAAWEFKWSSVPGASNYHLHVMGATAKTPLVDRSNLTSSEYRHESRGYVIDRNRLGWRWKVRALVGDVWTEWSEERTFDVQPLEPPAGKPLAERPFQQQIRSVVWDGEEFQPVYRGQQSLEEKVLGPVLERLREPIKVTPWEEGPAMRSVEPRGLAFHPDGRIAFSKGQGGNREMRLAFWSREGTGPSVVDLEFLPAGNLEEQARIERQGRFLFFAGYLTFDKSGTCYFSPGPVSPNGIYRVNSRSPVDIEKLYPVSATWSLQIPFFDPERIYATLYDRIDRYPIRGDQAVRPESWFRIQGDGVFFHRSLVLSPTKILAVVFAKGASRPSDTLCFDKESRSFTRVPKDLGPMAVSWDGKQMIRYDPEAKLLKEFRLGEKVEGNVPRTVSEPARPREPAIEEPGRAPKPTAPPEPAVPSGPYVVGKLNPADVAAILELVRSTPENVDKRILRIVVENPDQVVVWTGVQPSPKAGRGSTIRLKKVDGKWEIVAYGHWIS
jgi:uncharacterized protein (TIGR03067 family)